MTDLQSNFDCIKIKALDIVLRQYEQFAHAILADIFTARLSGACEDSK